MITADTNGLNAFQINSSTNLSFNNIIKPVNNPALRKLYKDAMSLLIYYLHQRKATFIGEMRLLRVQKREGEELIQLINSEYHLNADLKFVWLRFIGSIMGFSITQADN